jgi:hypothetical protein
MTWTEMITINSDTHVDKDQIIKMFYQLEVPPSGRGLADITLLCNNDGANGFCIRLTWQGEVSEKGKSFLGSRLAEAFSKTGRIHHSSWKRETSLFLLNTRAIDTIGKKPALEKGV